MSCPVKYLRCIHNLSASASSPPEKFTATVGNENEIKGREILQALIKDLCFGRAVTIVMFQFCFVNKLHNINKAQVRIQRLTPQPPALTAPYLAAQEF